MSFSLQILKLEALLVSFGASVGANPIQTLASGTFGTVAVTFCFPFSTCHTRLYDSQAIGFIGAIWCAGYANVSFISLTCEAQLVRRGSGGIPHLSEIKWLV